MLCAPRSFSFSPVAVAGEKCVWISPQSELRGFTFHVLLSRAVPVIVQFRS